MRDEDAVAKLFERVGAVDVLVNNAGVAESAPLARTTLADWRRQLDVNATGAFLCTRAAVPGMVERDSGRVVTVASTAGLAGGRYVAAYTASKHAAVGLMRAVAAEVAGTRRDGERSLPQLRAHADDRAHARAHLRNRPDAAARRRWPRWRRRRRSAGCSSRRRWPKQSGIWPRTWPRRSTVTRSCSTGAECELVRARRRGRRRDGDARPAEAPERAHVRGLRRPPRLLPGTAGARGRARGRHHRPRPRLLLRRRRPRDHRPARRGRCRVAPRVHAHDRRGDPRDAHLPAADRGRRQRHRRGRRSGDRARCRPARRGALRDVCVPLHEGRPERRGHGRGVPAAARRRTRSRLGAAAARRDDRRRDRRPLRPRDAARRRRSGAGRGLCARRSGSRPARASPTPRRSDCSLASSTWTSRARSSSRPRRRRS